MRRTRKTADRVRRVRKTLQNLRTKKKERTQAALWKKSFRHIMILDISSATDNVGDEIIYESSIPHLMPMIDDAYITTSSSHDGMGEASRIAAASADFILLLGTNALSSLYHVNMPFIWNVASEDVPLLRNKIVLFGVGANRDFSTIDPLQSEFLAEVLAKDFVHSTRDSLGARIVRSSGH